MTVDVVALEILRSRVARIAEDMGIVLRNASFSPNIKERLDCSAAIFTRDGEMLAQAEHIPVHLGSMPASVRAVLDRFGSDPHPDLQFAVNDPYAGGTHLNDLTLVRPVHHEGVHVGWVANRAHHADVGGEAPGSMPAHAVTVDQEGIVVAPMVAVEAGVWSRPFVEPFLAATRTPVERRGDLSAQRGGSGVARRTGVGDGQPSVHNHGTRTRGVWRAKDAGCHRRSSGRCRQVHGPHGVEGGAHSDHGAHRRGGRPAGRRSL